MRRAIVSVVLAAIGVFGVPATAQAQPADVPSELCEEGGGGVVLSTTDDGDVQLVCDGGEYDGQPISDGGEDNGQPISDNDQPISDDEPTSDDEPISVG
ncbi:hypothetical protein ABZ543_32030 [Streptomyces roseifaciens]